MNWLALIAAFSIALLVGASMARLLTGNRPSWTPRRRLWTAASVLPGFILLATLAGIGFILVTGPGRGENMQDLAVAATATVGAIFGLIALLGGLVGPSFAIRKG